MSDYIPQPGRGTLFKQPSDKPASWSGKVCLPDGQVAYLDLYPATMRDSDELRKDRDGNPWYNVRIKVMDRQGGDRPETPPQTQPDEDPFADTVPF